MTKPMKGQTILLFCLLSLLATSLVAQDAIVYGKVTLPVATTIRYTIQLSHVSGDVALYEVELNDKNNYAVSIELDEPTMLKMTYNKKDMWIFLWPGAYMEMDFSGTDFYNSFEYDGDAANENKYLAIYLNKFGIPDPFSDVTFFPSLSVSTNLFEKMNEMNTDAFNQYAKEHQELEQTFYDSYPSKNSLSEPFKNFMQTRINYRWPTYKLIQKDIAEKNGYETPDTFMFFLFDIDVNNVDALICYDYIAFMERYLSYTFEDIKSDTIDTKDKFQVFAAKYEMLNQLYVNKPLEMMQGRLLRRIISPKYVPFLTSYYQDYQDYTVTTSYSDGIRGIYEEATRFSNSAKAPDFELLNENGTKTKLSDFRGKIVYLSFWASWCQPCLAEMNKSIANREAVRDTSIVFLYVSVDDTADKWKRGIKNTERFRTNSDFHVYGTGRRSEVAKAYRVISLPQYFLIDKEGKFVTSFHKASSEFFVGQMIDLMR